MADRFKAADTLIQLAEDYDTSPQNIEEALRDATAVVVMDISRSERKPFLYTLGVSGALSRVKIR